MDLEPGPLRRECSLVGNGVSEVGTMKLVLQVDGEIAN